MNQEDVDLYGLVNREGVPVISYVNMETMSVEVFDENHKVSKKFLRIPYEEELCSYGQVMSDYLASGDISISGRMSASRYLREHGLYHDFCDYRMKAVVQALSEWFESHQISIA